MLEIENILIHKFGKDIGILIYQYMVVNDFIEMLDNYHGDERYIELINNYHNGNGRGLDEIYLTDLLPPAKLICHFSDLNIVYHGRECTAHEVKLYK